MEPVWDELCGSRRWGSLMAEGAPFTSREQLLSASEVAFDRLSRADWLEAFAAHSDIGTPRPGDRTGAGEQAGINGADRLLVAELAAAGAEYRRRFGFTFLIRARGRSAAEVLATLRARLDGSPRMEFATACAQQREIVALRLGDLTP